MASGMVHLQEAAVTLMPFDPFRQTERLAERALSGAGVQRGMPMEALRRGDEYLVHLDVPGVAAEDVEVTIERNVVIVRASRRPMRQDGDEVIIDERTYGEFTRQLMLGENLDAERLSAALNDGVLMLRIPISESSRPRRVQIGSATAEGAGTAGGSSGIGQSSQQPANV
jgi:HSP20 family protein